MNIKQKVVATALSGLAIAAVVTAAALAVPQWASAQTGTTAVATTTAAPGPNGPQAAVNGQGKYLADALGISQADLQAAQTKAHEAEIQQAVNDGLITQAQADAILAKTNSGSFFGGFGRGGMGLRPRRSRRRHGWSRWAQGSWDARRLRVGQQGPQQSQPAPQQ